MSEALRFHQFAMHRDEHQLEPDDRAMASYLIMNCSEWAVLTNIVITHPERTNVDGEVVLSCEPSTVVIPGSLAPNEERRVSLELITRGELPGRHALKATATFDCHPVSPVAEGLLEITVVAD